MVDGVVAELDADAALAAAAELRATADRAEARLLEVAAHFADLHREPFPARGGVFLPGMERAVVHGGEGCPEVAEFAPVELGAALGMTSAAAGYLIGDALALRHRLPKVWARVLAGEVQAWRGRRIAGACWRLSREAAALVDARVAPIADSVTVHRLDQIVAAAVLEVDPDQAQADADRVRGERGVWVGQSDLHGTKTMVVKAAAGDVIRFEATVDQVADRLGELGDIDGKDLRRAKAVGELADPQGTLDLWASSPVQPGRSTDSGCADHGAPTASDAPAACEDPTGHDDPASQAAPTGCDLPPENDASAGCGGAAGRSARSRRRVAGVGGRTLYVHLTDHTLATGRGVLRVEELGPMLATQLAELLGHGRVIVKPVIDLRDRVSVDAYEIPDRIRERVRLRYPVCVFPWCNRRATAGIDLDHVVPYDDTGPPGQTSTHNLAPGCRRHHRVKTHGRWTVRRLDDGAFEWTSPHRARYRVDHTGTHRFTDATAARPSPGTDHRLIDARRLAAELASRRATGQLASLS